MKNKGVYLKKVGIIVKKTIVIALCLFVIACGFTSKYVQYRQKDVQTQDQTTPLGPTTTRIVPDSADYGAYLAALMARENKDMEKASSYYAKALQGDPDNENLQGAAYLVSAFAGDMDQFMHTAQALHDQTGLFAPFALLSKKMKEHDYEGVLSQTQNADPQDMTDLVYPQARAWAYVGLKDEKNALKALKPLKKDKDLWPLYFYNEALVTWVLGDTKKAEAAFERLAQLEVPVLTSMLAIRKFYMEQGSWNEKNPLFEKYYQTIRENPSLMEVLIERANEFDIRTPCQGLAETFYIISTVAGKQTQAPETSLLFNTLALYLNPDGTTYKIWGAEQFESIEYYAQANRLYNSIPKPSDILLFKTALNLMLLNKDKDAEKIMLDIYARQPNDRLLLGMLGDLHKDQMKLDSAVSFYTKAIRLHRGAKDTQALGKTLFSRASVYDAMGWQEKAEVDLKEAISLFPNDALMLNYIGYMWLDSDKNIPEAVTYIQKAAELAPDEPHIMDSLAWAYYKQGEYQKALEYAEKSADLLPYSSMVQAHLGDIYQALGRTREAGYQYHKALELKADITPDLKAQLEEKLKK